MFGKLSNKRLDVFLLLIYLLLVFVGWMTLYSTTYSPDNPNWFALEHNKQLFFIIISLLVGFSILSLPNSTLFYTLSPVLYLGLVALAIFTAFFGKEINGARAWIDFGFFKLQPSEFLKYATALVFAAYLSKATPMEFKSENFKALLLPILILAISIMVIIMQKDMGTALVFTAFAVPLYREGLPGEIIGFVLLAVAVAFLALLIDSFALLILLVFVTIFVWLFFIDRQFVRKSIIIFLSSFAVLYFLNVILGLDISLGRIMFVSYILSTLVSVVLGYFWFRSSRRALVILSASIILLLMIRVTPVVYNHLPKHQKERIAVVLGQDIDPRGNAYNVIQSTRAIGSGGILGKGFMHGPQENKLVPFRQTDFIFCTVGEEWGFVGSLTVLVLYALLLWRIVYIAERQKSAFTRIYAYSIAGILFFHVFANIGSVIKLIPVIGIPLPFFSYGGSAIFNFTIMIFTLLRLDMDRNLQYEKIL